MQDFDLRELRYFLTAAEELNFSRAAERLGMSQPPLSRAIRRMERRLGAPLFHRGHNALHLTSAGWTLRDEALKVLEVASAAAQRTRRAAQAGERLNVTAAPGMGTQLLRRIAEAYAAVPGTPETKIAVTGCNDTREAAVRSGNADLAVLSTPFSATGLELCPLWSEERVAALPADHRLAGKGALRCTDLAGETFPAWSDETAEARRYYTGQDRALGDDTAPTGPTVADMSQLIEVVALGQAVALLPRHLAERNPRADVVYAPVADASPFSTVLAWPQDSADPAVALFAETAADLFGSPRAPGTGPSS